MSNPNRSTGRRFALKTLGLTAAGLALGGGGAWIKGRLDDAETADAAIHDLQARLTDTARARAALDATAASQQTQLAGLKDQIASAVGQNAQLATALSEAQREAADLKARLASVQSDLDAARAQLGKHQALAALYDRLESVGLDGLAQAGLAAVAAGFATALGRAPLVREGLALAHDLLSRFEQALPGLGEAMNWLGQQIVRLKTGLAAVELAARRTIGEIATGLGAVFGGFAKFILDRLPFNVGRDVRHALAATQTLLIDLPGLASGLTDNVLDQVSQRVSDGPQGWKATLVATLREKALAPSNQLLADVEGANAAFTASLQQPVDAALQQRAALREQIAAFRAANNL